MVCRMIPRNLQTKLEEATRFYPVVTLTGPRQSGKTVLVRHVFKNCDYVSLEDPELRRFALDDPRGFLSQFAGDVVIDEAQQVPELFSYIQVIVDKENRPGQFILTGSQHFLLLSKISQTLAGRCAVLHLLPFSLDELLGRPPWPVEALGGKPPANRGKPDMELWHALHTGFYPRIHDQGIPAQDWLKNYCVTYLSRDVREIVQVGDLETFERFLALCAGRSGALLNLSSLASDSGISHTTARRWISILETSFLILLLRPHHRNLNKRLVKSPKLYFLDTGLLCYLLRIREPGDLLIHAARGAVFESFVVSELHKRLLNAGLPSDLYFWRDFTGHEVDVIYDHGSEPTAIEIKSGMTIARDFFANLAYWRNLHNQPPPAALIYGGDRTFRQHDTNVCAWWNF